MKISKLFHWLYAILMFLPFGLVLFNCLHCLFSPSEQMISIETFQLQINGWFEGSTIFGNLSLQIWNVYNYLVEEIFSIVDGDLYLSNLICNLLTYWTCISIIWLVFDVFMYVPLLVHRWIDKAKLE